MTGYEGAALPEAWRSIPRIEKPFDAPELAKAVGQLIGARLQPAARSGSPGWALSDLGRRVHEACKEARNLITERRIVSRDVDPEG